MRIVMSGASMGIGRYLATNLVNENHEVWGLARSIAPLKSLQAEIGEHFVYSQCDVSSYKQLSEILADVAKKWHSIDALICCAGVQGAIGKAIETNPAEWSETVRINLDGTYYMIHVFHDLLTASQSRSKVLCFSGGGATSPRTHFSAYGVSKAALVRLVETLAKEWEDQPIDINAIAPGGINTRMTKEVIEAGPVIAGEEYHNAIKQQETGGASLEKVSQLVNYLLSSDSDGISGKLISAVWDPWNEFAAHRQEIQSSDLYTLRRIVPQDRGFDWE